MPPRSVKDLDRLSHGFKSKGESSLSIGATPQFDTVIHEVTRDLPTDVAGRTGICLIYVHPNWGALPPSSLAAVQIPGFFPFDSNREKPSALAPFLLG